MKFKKVTCCIILLLTIFLFMIDFTFASPSDPVPFGNLTADTAFIGGTIGVGNFTGNVYADNLFGKFRWFIDTISQKYLTFN